MIGDAAEPSGTVAVRLTDGEAAALSDALAAAAEKTRQPNALLDLEVAVGCLPPEIVEHALIRSAARKVWALLDDDVVGLEIRAVRR